MALFVVLCPVGLIVSCSINDTFVVLCPVGLIVSYSINGTLCYVISHGFYSELFYKWHPLLCYIPWV